MPGSLLTRILYPCSAVRSGPGPGGGETRNRELSSYALTLSQVAIGFKLSQVAIGFKLSQVAIGFELSHGSGPQATAHSPVSK